MNAEQPTEDLFAGSTPRPEDSELAAARERWNATKGARLHEHAAHTVIADSVAKRRDDQEHGRVTAPAPTGVRLKSPKTGAVQDIYNDGSVRNLYAKNPAISKRQFRKMRKLTKRAVKHADQKVLSPIVALLPPIPGHTHTIGDNLQPTCGCAFTPAALDALRAYVRQLHGTPIAEATVDPETSTNTQE